MKRPPRSSRFEIIQMKRVDFLKATLQRLQDDVGTILGLIDSHNHQSFSTGGRTIGFWASLRMILPIVEAVSHVMNMRPQRLLGNHLNISTPDLMWDLFRHSLIHGDYLQEGKFQGKKITWGVGFHAGGHIITSGHIGIDIPTLYQDLVTFLVNEVSNNDQTLVNVETGVEYGITGNPNPGIVTDFSRL